MKTQDYLSAIISMEKLAHIAMSPTFSWRYSPSLWRITDAWRESHNLCGGITDWKAHDMTAYINFLEGAIFG